MLSLWLSFCVFSLCFLILCSCALEWGLDKKVYFSEELYRPSNIVRMLFSRRNISHVEKKSITLRQVSRQEIKIWKTEPKKKLKYKGKQSVNKLQVELTWKNNSSLIYVKLIGNRKGLLLDRLTCKRITSFWYIANTFWMFWKLNRIKTYHERLSKA